MPASEYNKEAIINAAARVFKKYGFEKTSISNISAVLGKGRTSVYNHFKNKEEIFTAVVEKHMGMYLNELNNMLLAQKTAAEKMAVFCSVKFSFSNPVQKEFILLHDGIIHHPLLKTSLAQSTSLKEIKIIESIINTGIKKGEFKQMPPKQVKFTALLFYTTITAVINNLYDKADTKNFTTAGKIVQSMFISSLINKAS